MQRRDVPRRRPLPGLVQAALHAVDALWRPGHTTTMPRDELVRLRRAEGIADDGPTEAQRKRWHEQEKQGRNDRLMPYFGVDDGFAFHRKAVRAGNAALGLWVRAGAWCNQQLTDGFVPHEIADVLGTAPQVARLVAAELWHEVPGGYQFHEFTEEKRNFSRAEVLEKRAKDRERKAKARTAKSEKTQVAVDGHTGSPNGIHEESQGDSALSHPIPSHPKRKRQTTSVSARKRAHRLPDDFTVTDEMREWARENAPTCGQRDHDAFCDYWWGKSGKDATKVDWVATWRNWMRREHDQRRNGSRASPTVHQTDASIARLLGNDQLALPRGDR